MSGNSLVPIRPQQFRFQAFSAYLNRANWPGDKAEQIAVIHAFSSGSPIQTFAGLFTARALVVRTLGSVIYIVLDKLQSSE